MAIKSNFAKFLLHALLPGIGTAIVGYTDDNQGWAKEEDKLYTKFMKGLNMTFSDRPWFDYDKWNSAGEAFENKMTGNALTPAEQAANQFSADEALKQREWEEYMSSTSYQRQVKDMQAAGINPALAMSGSAAGASTPSGSAATSVSPQSGMSMSDLMALVMMPVQRRLLRSQAKMFQDQGTAALLNAGANVRNADTNVGNLRVNERNAGTNEFNAETNRLRQQVDAWMARLDVPIKQATADRIAADAAQIREVTRQLPDRLEVLKQQGNAAERQAYASLQSALAQNRQAAVAEKKADAEVALMQAETFVRWAAGDGQVIVNQYLDESEQAKIRELASRSDFLDANAENMDRNAKVQWMQTISGYANAACNVANTVMSVVSGVPGSSAPIGF